MSERSVVILAVCITLFIDVAPVRAEPAGTDYAAARAELVAAYRAQDYGAMVAAARKSLQARPGYPGALFNLALAQALDGDARGSLQTLHQLLALGADFGVAAIDEFAPLRELPGWAAYADAVARLNEPAGFADVALALDDGGFVPEGIAIDGQGRIYLGSIRRGQVVSATSPATVLSDRAGHWSVFGMRFADDGSLWFASAAVPQLENVGADAGRTGLFQLDVASGDILRAAILPEFAPEQVLGDLVIRDENIYTTDSLTGAVYEYSIAGSAFRDLVPRGTFGSPQGLALSADGAHLYVADYLGGLFRVALADGSVHQLDMPAGATAYGIDGLYRYGRELVAIVNGVRPHRVIALRLADDGLAITGTRTLAASLPQFDEPTLGAIRGDDFYFVANSHWNRFTADHDLPAGLAGPVVLRISLLPADRAAAVSSR